MKWTDFYLYVMLDIFSRYVVGWMVAHRESATLAERFIRETCVRQGIARDQLTIHADREPAMTSKPVALLTCNGQGLAVAGTFTATLQAEVPTRITGGGIIQMLRNAVRSQ